MLDRCSCVFNTREESPNIRPCITLYAMLVESFKIKSLKLDARVSLSILNFLLDNFIVFSAMHGKSSG